MSTTKSEISKYSFQTSGVAEVWQREASAAKNGLLIFSPFITSKTAETVLSSATTAEIHTRFDVHNFASGASSLATLRALNNAGHRIFHVKNLHAKIVLSKGNFVSIGSQNLTYRGTKNRELTALFDGPNASEKVEKLVAPWLVDRMLVTSEMIDKLDALVGPAAERFDQAKKEAAGVQQQFTSWMELLAPARTAEDKPLHVARRRAVLQEKMLERPASSDIEARVEDVRGKTVTRSLKPLNTPHASFTNWRVGAEVYRLQRLYRYLCVHEQTGQLGWVRVAERRITYISRSRVIPRSRLRLPFLLRGVFPAVVSIRALRSGDLAEKGNLRIRFSINGVFCSLRAWYAPGTLEVISSSSVDDDLLAQEFRAEMAAHPGQFEKAVTKALSRPFAYKVKLSGRGRADSFFGPKVVQLSLMLDGDHPVLVSKPLK